jgi:hypothetical protein
MVALHAAAGWIVLLLTAALIVVAFVVARLLGHRAWLETAWKVVVGAVALEASIGIILYATGDRPKETLHLLYGVVAVVALPAASSFAQDAPPKARSWVLVVGGAFTLLMVWRLFSTGT